MLLESISAEGIPSAEDYKKARENNEVYEGSITKNLEGLPYAIEKPVRLKLYGDYEPKSKYITITKRKYEKNIQNQAGSVKNINYIKPLHFFKFFSA